jgi:hypothetical protein
VWPLIWSPEAGTPLNAVHVPSGTGVSPMRYSKATSPSASHASVLQSTAAPASRTRDVNVPGEA